MPSTIREARQSTRQWSMRLGAALVLGATLGLGATGRAGNADHAAGALPSADRVIATLKAGNARFVAGETDGHHRGAAWRKGLIAGQHPEVTVIGCSDSRVPPELLFDEGFGDVFTIRVAGNIVDEDVAGSVEYGIDHLHAPVVLVLGHESCGAVTAAVQAHAATHAHVSGHGGSAEPAEIRALLAKIEPALDGVDPKLEGAARIAASVEANVRRTIAELGKVPDIARALAAGRVRIVGAVYELGTGRVRFLSDASPGS